MLKRVDKFEFVFLNSFECVNEWIILKNPIKFFAMMKLILTK